MFIKSLKVTNFKSFEGMNEPLEFNIPNGTEGSGLNIFVGENNTGKSTIFEAVEFLKNGTKKDVDKIKNQNNDGIPMVELTFCGDIEAVIDAFSQPNKVDVFKRHIFKKDEKEFIKFSRTYDNRDVVKKIKLWSEDDKEYRNESGIDAPVKKLFEIYFIWADTNPNDQINFGATTVSGILLKEIANTFTETEEYLEFSKKFDETFNNEDSVMRKELKKIEEKTQEIFKDQFGSALINFHFNELKIDSFFKNISVDMDDGVKTPIEEKGSGMQRSLALALIQVYAERITRNQESDNAKPFFLFIDEPEICLHPKAQEKLFKALLELSKKKQVFLTTHSPYFLVSKYLKTVGLFVFKKIGNKSVAKKISDTSGLFPWSPTWGEINYMAYNFPTVEFHNELYGRLQELSKKWGITDFDNWLETQGVEKNKEWTKEKHGEPEENADSVTLPTFIRNKIHHPENSSMISKDFTREELKESIDILIRHIQNFHS